MAEFSSVVIAICDFDKHVKNFKVLKHTLLEFFIKITPTIRFKIALNFWGMCIYEHQQKIYKRKGKSLRE